MGVWFANFVFEINFKQFQCKDFYIVNQLQITSMTFEVVVTIICDLTVRDCL